MTSTSDSKPHDTIKQCQRWYRIKSTMVQRLVEDGVEIVDKMIRCRKPASGKDLEGRFCAKHRITTPVEGFEPVVEKVEKFEESILITSHSKNQL